MPEDIALLLDENIPLPIEAWLRDHLSGCDVIHALNTGLAGKPDKEVFHLAQKQGRIIVTFDEDLADARMFPLGEHHGIIRLRIWPTTTEATQEAFIRLREALPFADWRGNLIIIDNQQIRLRRKPPAH